MLKARKIIITGGPGSGKTSVINRLAEKGYVCFPEAAREVIREQLRAGTEAVPWKNLPKFTDLVFSRIVEKSREADHVPLSFFDRGLPDLTGYLQWAKIPVPPHYESIIRSARFYPTAFIAPPWREIYFSDEERRESFRQSAAIYHCLVSAYSRLGFSLLALPKSSVEDRSCYVLESIS